MESLVSGEDNQAKAPEELIPANLPKPAENAKVNINIKHNRIKNLTQNVYMMDEASGEPILKYQNIITIENGKIIKQEYIEVK